MLVREDGTISEYGLFKGKKISELPNFMQRIYQKKKILYSKHLMSAPSNNNLPAETIPKTQEKPSKKIIEEDRQGESVEMSGVNEP